MGFVACRYLAILQNPCSSCYHPHFSLHMAPTDKMVAIAEADTLLVISRLGILHTNLLGRVVDVMTMEGFSCKWKFYANLKNCGSRIQQIIWWQGRWLMRRMQGVVGFNHLFHIVVAFLLLQLQTTPLATNSGLEFNLVFLVFLD